MEPSDVDIVLELRQFETLTRIRECKALAQSSGLRKLSKDESDAHLLRFTSSASRLSRRRPGG